MITRRLKLLETVIISNEHLRTRPFFKRFNQTALLDEAQDTLPL